MERKNDIMQNLFIIFLVMYYLIYLFSIEIGVIGCPDSSADSSGLNSVTPEFKLGEWMIELISFLFIR
jgi:hypothetical protein